MAIHPSITVTGCSLFAILTFVGLPTSWADDLDSIRYGEAARTFAAGSIQQSTPQDGIVNAITGDNQTVGDRLILGQYDIYYLKLANPADVAIGDLFTVYKRARKVFHPATRRYMGFLINRVAIVRIVQIDQGLATAKALHIYGPAAPNDPIMKFSLPVPDETPSDPAGGEVTGMVAELQADMQLTLVAQRNIVYLDRGSQDGLKIGDRMDIVRYGGALPPRRVGEVKVLFTEKNTATALITKSTSRILKSDRFQTKAEAGELIPTPVSRPTTPSPDNLPDNLTSASNKIQNASRETRYSLSDLMKQLHYESGDATIKPEGYQLLDQLVELLKAEPAEQLIRVEGHADNMEIGPSLKSIYPTNWDLSKARATGVLRYLVEKGGIDSARLSTIGYGATKPVSSNATEAGRQKNRRVDIVLYSADSAKAPTEQAMKPTDAADDGYRMPGLENKQDTTMPVVDKAVPPEQTKAEVPAAIPPASIADVPPVEGNKSASDPADKAGEPPRQ